MRAVKTPLSGRARHAYLRFGVSERAAKAAWAHVAGQAAGLGYTGMLFFSGLVRSRGDWWFIAHTEEAPRRSFGMRVEVMVEPSTVTKTGIAWHGSRWRGIPTPAFRSCCGRYVPEGHLETCTRKPRRALLK